MPAAVITPAEIQPELDRIWEALEGTAKTRASLFNLIFYTEKREREKYIHRIAQNVIEKFPSRVIFITADSETNKDLLETRVSVMPAGDGNSEIACDLIEIDVAGPSKERIPFIILPHILADLPIYVIWGEDPSRSAPLFEQLQKLATKLIFDSETTDDLPNFAGCLLNLRSKLGCDISDLNWARVESWRNLLSSTFYTQERLGQLKNAETIQILYNAHETSFTCHTQIQAIYLQGWLASRLKWPLIKITREDMQFTFEYKSELGPVNIMLYPESHLNIKAGSVISLDLTTRDQNHFSFGRNLDHPHQISMRFSTLDKCAIPLKYLFEKAESGQSLVKEISHKGTSLHYVTLMQNIQTIKELRICET